MGERGQGRESLIIYLPACLPALIDGTQDTNLKTPKQRLRAIPLFRSINPVQLPPIPASARRLEKQQCDISGASNKYTLSGVVTVTITCTPYTHSLPR